MKSIIFSCFIFLCYASCEANLVHVDGPVYQTDGFYGGKTFWYLDMSQLYNKTAQQQQNFINSLNNSKAYGLSSWHMTVQEEGEIYDLIDLYGIGGERNTELANVLGLNKSVWYYFRTLEADNTYHTISFDYVNYVNEKGWRAARFVSPVDPYSYLGAFVVATPEPATLLLLGLGGVLLRRHSNKR